MEAVTSQSNSTIDSSTKTKEESMSTSVPINPTVDSTSQQNTSGTSVDPVSELQPTPAGGQMPATPLPVAGSPMSSLPMAQPMAQMPIPQMPSSSIDGSSLQHATPPATQAPPQQPQTEPQQQQGSWLTITTSGGMTLGYVRVDDPERDLTLKDVRELVDERIRETAEYSNGWVFAKTGNQQLIILQKDEAQINAVELCPTIAVIPAQSQIPQMGQPQFPGMGQVGMADNNPIPTGMPGYNSIPGMPGMQTGPNGMPVFNPLMLQHQLMLQAQRAEKLRQNHVSCPICGRLFPSSSDVKRHMRTHDRLKPFKCPFCPKAYTQRGTLYRHSKSKHGKQIRVARTKEILQGTVSIPGVDAPAPAPVPVADGMSPGMPSMVGLGMPPNFAGMGGLGGMGGLQGMPGMPDSQGMKSEPTGY